VSFLNAVIDAHPASRKALAIDAGVSEPTFAKLTRSSAFALLDRLPRPVIVAWLQRYAQHVGLEVRSPDPVYILEELRETAARVADLVSRYEAIERTQAPPRRRSA
jgi:hypothetical protein